MTTTPEKELSLKLVIEKTISFVRFLFRHRVIILIFFIIGVAGGIIDAWLKPAQYEAALSFTADEERGASGGIANIAAEFGFNIQGGGTVFTGDNLLALITSKRIVTRALLKPVVIKNRKTTLLNSYIEIYLAKAFETDTALRKVSFPLQQNPVTFNRLQDSIIQEICEAILKKNISALRPDKRLDIYEISCVSTDESFSLELSKQIVKEVSEFYIETKTKRSLSTVDILQNKADSIKREYVEALSGRAALADANINPALQEPVVGIQRKQTDITVLATAYTEVIKNLEIAKFNLLQNTPLIQVIDEPRAPLKKIKPGRLLTGLLWGILFGFAGILVAYGQKVLKEITAQK